MADAPANPGTNQQPGPAGATTVVQLQPVTYQLSLHYLGHNRVTHNARYRCFYELHEGNVPMTTFPRQIPSVIVGSTTNAADIAAATPHSEGGDSQNPANDDVFRIVVTDNHALRNADIGFLGRPDGDTNSKSDSYTNRNWLRDVAPVVPLRVVVRKFVGNTQVDFDKSFKAVVEVKDPTEEVAQNDGQRRSFLEAFFNKFNRTDANPTVGDDNASTVFDGIRPASASDPGVRARDVLRDVPYASPPVLDVAPAGVDTVSFGSLASAPAFSHQRAAFTIVARDDGNGRQVGVSDFAFLPGVVAGDNYRFLIHLVQGNTDVRDLQENGAPVRMTDEVHLDVPKPLSYTTGRFVTWKKVDMRLVILANGTTNADITWASTQAMYQKTFVEIVPPPAANFFTLTAAAWRTELRAHFDPAGTNAQFNNAANFNAAAYAASFIPAFLLPTAANPNASTWGDISAVSRRCIRHACGQLVPAINPVPLDDTNQNNLPGHFVVLLRMPNPNPYPAVGAYIGDRIYWFGRQGSSALTTTTFSHELGHALYFRHSHTQRTDVNYTDAAGNAAVIELTDGRRNNNIYDHDQVDAHACLMSYTRPLTAEPCAMCALTARMFDRVEIARRNRFGDESMAGLSPARIVVVTTGAAGAAAGAAAGLPQLNETIPNLPNGNQMALMAVGPQRAFTDRGGNANQGRVNMSGSADNPGSLWTQAGAGRVTITPIGGGNGRPHNRVRITGTRVGAVTVTFTLDSVSTAANFQVT
ncbi:MAG: hypothetical protein ACR2GY_02680 [Phycisphaerales bacterium]